MSHAVPANLEQVGAGVLRAAAAFTTPLLPDDYLAVLNPLWSTRGRVAGSSGSFGRPRTRPHW